MYWFAGISKLSEHWFDGTAMQYVLRLEIYVRPFGSWLLGYPVLLKAVTYGTLVLELFGPFLLFIPFWNERFRIIAILAFWSLHIGIDLSLDVGMFSMNSMAVWLCLVPSFVWTRGVKEVESSDQTSNCKSQTKPRSKFLRYLTSGIAIFFLAYTFLWNTLDIDYLVQRKVRERLPRDFYKIGWATMVAQKF